MVAVAAAVTLETLSVFTHMMKARLHSFAVCYQHSYLEPPGSIYATAQGRRLATAPILGDCSAEWHSQAYAASEGDLRSWTRQTLAC